MDNLAAVVCDLDGSLLDSRKKIHPDDLAAIRTLKARGVRFFISTGRHFAFAKQIVSEVGFDYPVCDCNGAQIYDYRTGRTLYAAPRIAPETVRAMTRFLRARGISFILYDTERPVFDSPDSRRAQHWMTHRESFAPENRFEMHFLDEPGMDIDQSHVLKFLVAYVDEPVRAEIEARFNADHTLNILWSEKDLLDINAAGVSKGSGLRELARLFSFDLADTLVLGDNFNDASMLEICGFPVVPANGEAPVRAIARYITADNDHAPLSHALRALAPALLR